MPSQIAQTEILNINYSQSDDNSLLIKGSQLSPVQTLVIIKTISRRQSTNRFTCKY